MQAQAHLGFFPETKDKVVPSSSEKSLGERAEGVTSSHYAMLPWSGAGWAQLPGVAEMLASDLAIRKATWETTAGHFPF